MKLVIYCQHVLGVGHFFRALEIALGLKSHDVILVTGGGRIPASLPGFIRHVSLPGLMMDKNFSGLYSLDKEKSLDQVKEERRKQLLDLINTEAPDIFLVELYPFGRKAFRFELDPVLEKIRQEKKCKVVCSTRDILVEKKNTHRYESRVVDTLNNYFDALFIHSDPEIIRLDETFSLMDNIAIPIYYTGFVTPFPESEKTPEIKKEFLIGPKERLVLVSTGGGSVGEELLQTAARAHSRLKNRDKIIMVLISGPYLAMKHQQAISSMTNSNIRLIQFHKAFVSLLKAADLAIVMGGYNTLMNALAAETPLLVYPFEHNREQTYRIQKLKPYSNIRAITAEKLNPESLAKQISETLEAEETPALSRGHLPDLKGAETSCRIIEEMVYP